MRALRILRMMRRKDREIRIRCTEETYRAWRRYAADFRNYEEALRSLLDKAGALRVFREL